MIYKEALTNNIFNHICNCADELGIECYVIGGFVRDYIIDNSTAKDIDIVVVGDGIEFAKHVSKKLKNTPKVTIFKTYGTAMFKYNDMEIEFVGARKESYTKESRNPKVSVGTLEDDQNRRDFTINSMAFSLNKMNYGALVDPFNGLADIQNKVIRTPLSLSLIHI